MDPSAGYLRQSYSSSTFQTRSNSTRHWRQIAANGQNVGGHVDAQRLPEPPKWQIQKHAWESKWREAERTLKRLRKDRRRDEKAIQDQEFISAEAKREERLCEIYLIIQDEGDTLSKEHKDTLLKEGKNIEQELRQLRGEEDLENNQKPNEKKEDADKKALAKKKH